MEDQTTLDRIIAEKTTTWLTHTDNEGNIDTEATCDYILSCVHACLDDLSPVKGISSLMRAVVLYAVNCQDKESVKEAMAAFAGVMRINDCLNYFNGSLNIFTAGFDEYLEARRREKGNEIYPN